MQKITIIAVGNLREDYLKKAYNEYAKRISRFAKLEVIEIKETTILKEGEEVLKKLKAFSKAFFCALAIDGAEHSSESFAKKVVKDKSHLVFIIGGSEGLSSEILSHCDNISFGKITFPHQLMRVVLAEQIYRSFKILGGEKYHK